MDGQSGTTKLTVYFRNSVNVLKTHIWMQQLIWLLLLSLSAWRSQIITHHVTKHNTPIHNILSSAPQLRISQKALGTLPDDGNLMPKHVGATIHIKKVNE
jgi:hypothetical protein